MTPLLAAVVISCAGVGVIDGDTLNVCGERVRIWGIQAPERHHPAGPASTRALADLTRGKCVVCVERGPRSYGRLVARCSIGGSDLACEMVRRGVAQDWPKYSRGFYQRCQRALAD